MLYKGHCIIEAEQFGAEAGTYTGATRACDDRLELADRGTLFLDEIGNLRRAGNRVAIEPDRAQLEAALAAAGGVVSRAAASLGLSRQAFYRRLEKTGTLGDAGS